MLFAARDEEVIILATFGCGGVLAFVGLILLIFYLIGLMKALQACSPRNQTMAPGLVWLNLVPILGLVWSFVTVVQVGNSLQREFRDRGMDRGGGYGKVLGILMHVVALFAPCFGYGGLGVAIAVDDGDESPIILAIGAGIGGLFGLVYMVLWIVYWVQITGFTRALNSSRGHDDFDDRPRRRGHDDDREGDDRRRDDFDDNYRPRQRRDD